MLWTLQVWLASKQWLTGTRVPIFCQWSRRALSVANLATVVVAAIRRQGKVSLRTARMDRWKRPTSKFAYFNVEPHWSVRFDAGKTALPSLRAVCWTTLLVGRNFPSTRPLSGADRVATTTTRATTATIMARTVVAMVDEMGRLKRKLIIGLSFPLWVQ